MDILWGNDEIFLLLPPEILFSSIYFLILMFLGFPVSTISSFPSGLLNDVNQGMFTILVRIRYSEEGRKKFG